MGDQLVRSIAAQPRVLREIATSSYGPQAELLAAADRITLVGTGTSLHAAQLGAWLMRQRGLDARAVSALDAAHFEPAVGGGDALVVISHTGQTAYALRVRAAAVAAGIPLVTITGAAAAWPEAIATATHETSETYTVSYLAALAVLGRLADEIREQRGLSARAFAASGPALLDAAARIEAIIDDPRIGRIACPERALVIVAPGGPWAVTAREGALKIREASRLLAEGYDAESLLHGAAVPLGRGDALIALQPDADTDGLVNGVAAAAHAEGVAVTRLENPAAPADPFYAQFPLTVRLQLLAAQFAQRRGHDADVAIVGCWAADSLWRTGAPEAEAVTGSL